MQQKVINFEIAIPNTAIKHLKEKSHYDYNFYHIGNYGDWLYGDLNTILQIYNECSNCYRYQYGYFDKSDKFVTMLYWTTQVDIFEGIE